MEAHKLDPKVPTLFYAECVLSFLDSDRVDELMGFINQTFDLAFVFDYEMYNPNDRFGQMMVKNFDMRGCPLVGIYKYPYINNQQERYIKNGFKHTEVYTMKDV
jgi:O-methyltransferase involved in polyketide biosynthesis